MAFLRSTFLPAYSLPGQPTLDKHLCLLFAEPTLWTSGSGQISMENSIPPHPSLKTLHTKRL